jgi:cytochrome c-type biogenesis protein CcmH
MIAWLVLTLMVAVAAVGVAMPLVRRREVRRGGAAESAVLDRRLAEIRRQAAAEGLPADLAEGLRTEAIRRFLAESPVAAGPARPLGARSATALALGMAATVAIGAMLLYASVGRPDLAAGAPLPRAPPPDAASADAQSPEAQSPEAQSAAPGVDAELIARLEARMRQSPGDPIGWRMLGWAYAQTGRLAEAAVAYGRAAALDPTKADYPSAQGEALVRAADGRVTPPATAAFTRAIRLDPGDPRARYFLAAAKDQAGDHAGAMADWIALLKSAPPGAPWAPEVRAMVIRIAASRGETVAARLPPAPAAPPGAAGPGPDPSAAIQGMAPAQQQAMIHAMVERLAARLKANPRDADGWVGLMRARMVLGEPGAASGAYRDAVKAFADAPAQRDLLSQAARRLKVPGA